MLSWRIANTAEFRVRIAATTGLAPVLTHEVFVSRPKIPVCSEEIDDVVVEHSLRKHVVAHSLALKEIRHFPCGKQARKKDERCSARLRDLGENRHDDDVMTMGGDGDDDDANGDSVS